MKTFLYLTVLIGCLYNVPTANAQGIIFDFNSGPAYTGTPLDQSAGGIRAHFTGQNGGSGYSIQNTAQVIGVLPTGFSGLGLSPNSVYGADLSISFFKQSDGMPVEITDLSILVAPQELACDSSSKMRITAYKGTNLVGTKTATAPSLDTYTWPTITLSFSSIATFDNVVIHFESGPPTGGDWGGIFVADNLNIIPAAAPSISGVVTLEQCVNPVQTLSLEFRPVQGGSALLRTVTLSGTGAFAVTDVPPGQYDLAIKGSKWLRTVIAVDSTAGDVTNANATLLGGDANDDNRIDIADFSFLINAYGGDMVLPGSGYNTATDFNCDGVVEILDFGIIVNNYGAIGAL